MSFAAPLRRATAGTSDRRAGYEVRACIAIAIGWFIVGGIRQFGTQTDLSRRWDVAYDRKDREGEGEGR